MRRKILRVSSVLIPDLFLNSGKHLAHFDGMPDDAKIVDCRFDGFADVVEFAVESEAFPEVPLGGAAPYFNVEMKRKMIKFTGGFETTSNEPTQADTDAPAIVEAR